MSKLHMINPHLPRVDEMRGIFGRAEKVREPGPASPTREPRALPRSDGDIALGIGERRCAIAIAQHPNGVAREQLTTLTGYKRSTRNTYLQRLLAAELVTQNGERFAITEQGIDWIGSDYQPLPAGAELQRYWIDKLPAGESAVFQVVLQHAGGISREEIGEQTNFKRSTRNTYLQRLAARELVNISGDVVRPSETLSEAT
jgi:predicted transcriptional regulator